MTRQVYELASKESQVTSHLTSLTPIRPENRPDQWESAALQAFEQGGKEASAVVVDHGKRYLRLMKPLTTGENCLRCHAHQGYRLGDNRGGISVMLPMEPFESSLHQEITMLWVGHGSLWLLGILGIRVGTSSVKRHMDKRNQITEELEKANVQLQQQASTDILTGICNRLKCVEVMQAETARAKRYSTPLSLIMFDIDHFKAINDTWGHDMGDRVLIEVAALVASHVRASDLFARWGGEEFMIVCPGTSWVEGAKLAEKLRLLIAAHDFTVPDRLTCSFGVTTLLEADSGDSLCKRADVAMYLAKRGGRNRVEAA
jgi:diguanylate cyclase (GGDEF)-like protein